MKKNKQLEVLKKSFKEGKHAHAYLFYGVGSINKRETALAFASMLTGHKEEGLNPDVFLVGLKSEEAKISINQIREIRKFLAFEPYYKNNKVVIIDTFELMMPEASSALLKILEEPPKKSILILISDHPNMILPTILSRVHKISFFEGEVQGIDKRREIYYTLSVLITTNIAERFNMVEKIAKEDTVDLLEYWLSFFRDLAYIRISGSEFLQNAFYEREMKKVLEVKQYTLSQISSIISDLVYFAHIDKTSNANKKLVLENIVLTF